MKKIKIKEERQRREVLDSFVRDRGVSVCQVVDSIKASQAAARKMIRKIKQEEAASRPAPKPAVRSAKKSAPAASAKKENEAKAKPEKGAKAAKPKKDVCESPSTPSQLVKCMEQCCESFRKGPAKK